MLPRSQHSPFGDFPADYMKTLNKETVQPVPKIEEAEQSIAHAGKCKFLNSFKLSLA